MLKNLTKLLISLSLISNLSYAETTNNLVSQDFTTGWSGTNLNSLHGSTTIAGVNNSYIESDSVSLNSQDINKESLNEGFTVTGSAEYWFWSGYNASVTQTIKTVDDNGNTLTQTRVVTGTSGSYNTLSDQLIVSSNTQQDYNVSLRYDFADSSGYNSHYSADLKNPYLSVTYTYVPPLDTATQTALLDLNKTIKEDLKDVQSVEIKEEEVTLKTETLQTAKVENAELTTTSKDSSAEATPVATETSDSQKENLQESKTEEAAPSSSQAEQSSDEGSDKESQTSTEEKQTEQAASDSSDKKEDGEKNVSLGATIDKIDVQVKDPGKNLELKNIVMLDKMMDNSALEVYANVEFYKPKNIYLDQIDIRDNRVLYADASLVSYQQKDPIFQTQKAIFDIRQAKEKLIREIQVLKNVR